MEYDDRAHDPNDATLRSWLDVPSGSDFPVQSLAFGVVAPRRTNAAPRGAVAIGDHVLDLAVAQRVGLLDGCDLGGEEFAAGALNAFLALGPRVWRSVRRRVSWLLTRAEGTTRDAAVACLAPRADVDARLPIEVADYTDFYSSRHHAENLGRILRPGSPPLLPNWPYLPVGYHGRAGTVVVSGTPVHRPRGLVADPERDGRPVLRASRRLDVEVELGFVVGAASPTATPLRPDAALDHVFGALIVNDWSARDIQAFEYQPLGPFLGKSFATSVSPWLIPLEALAPAFVAPPPPEVERDPYLVAERDFALPVELTLSLAAAGSELSTLARVDARHLSFTFAAQLAHLTVNGAGVRTGDLYASGTISGPERGACGSLIELTDNGTAPLHVGGAERAFLEDGDRVVISAECTRPDGVRIGFGSVEGTIVAAEEG